MKLLQETIAKIYPLDQNAINNVKETLYKNLPNCDKLGELTDILYHYAGITREMNLSIPKKCTIIACADHGVAAMKTSAYPVETTVHMTKNYLISKGSVANALANFSKSNMVVVDMGIASPMDSLPGLLHRKIAFGTKNCAKEAAMTREDAIKAIHTGIELANMYARQNYRCFLPGEMGIANTTSSAAIVATICQLAPEVATGRGTNISDDRLKLKIDVVRQALEVNEPNPTDGIDVLAKVGGFELGCITGIILGAAANRAFVVLDGFNTGAAALIATRLCPAVKHYIMASHLAAEPAHKQTLEKIGIHPYMDMNFRLGEATGSSIAVNFLDVVVKTYQQFFTPKPLLPPKKNVAITSATFTRENILNYVQEIKSLDLKAMSECQLYIDNLTKPLHSLGALEDMAVKLAGITGSSKPAIPKRTLLAFTSNQLPVTNAFALHAEASITFCEQIAQCDHRLAALTCGIKCTETIITHGDKIIGFSSVDAKTQATAERIFSLCKKSDALDFLTLFGDNSTAEFTAMVGAILAAAHNRALIVTDGFASQVAAYVAIKIAPMAKNYILIPQYSPLPSHQALKTLIGLPDYLNLNITIDAGCNSTLGMKLMDAAMHMLHDMKTFEAASVATANDGPGRDRQKNK